MYSKIYISFLDQLSYFDSMHWFDDLKAMLEVAELLVGPPVPEIPWHSRFWVELVH